MDRGAWWATVHGIAKESDTTKQLNDIHLAGYSKSYHDPVLNKQNSVHETKIHKD